MIFMTENNEEYPMDETDIVIDDVTTQTVETPVFEFTLADKTHPDYKCCVSIIQWIKQNLEDLTDDNYDPIFSKVNYGYNSETLKGFNKKPVADVYLNNLGYNDTFDNNKPDHVNSFIICSLVTPSGFGDKKISIVSLSSSGTVVTSIPDKSCNIRNCVGSECPRISSFNTS